MDKSTEILDGFRNRLLFLMEKNGWNVPELSERAGIKYTTLRGILGKDISRAGKGGPTFLVLHTIATNLRNSGVSAEWLLTGENPPRLVESAQIDYTEPGIEEWEADAEGENQNVRSEKEMDVDYDELADAVVELIEITRDSPENFKYSLMKQLKSCVLVQDYLESQKKRGSRLKTRITEASSTEDRRENDK